MGEVVEITVFLIGRWGMLESYSDEDSAIPYTDRLNSISDNRPTRLTAVRNSIPSQLDPLNLEEQEYGCNVNQVKLIAHLVNLRGAGSRRRGAEDIGLGWDQEASPHLSFPPHLSVK